MRTIEKTIYKFDELSDSSKERAREWYRRGLEYPWRDEVQSSLGAFCDEFGIKVEDYSIGGRGAFIRTNAENSHFRGLKLSQFDREAMPSGFCFDCALPGLDWTPEAVFVHWEGEDLICAHSGRVIPSAYGSDDE